MGPKDPLCDTYTKSNMRVHSWTLILRYFGYFILGIRGPKDRSEQIIKRSIHGPFYYLRYRMMLQSKLALRAIYFIASCSYARPIFSADFDYFRSKLADKNGRKHARAGCITMKLL